MKLIFLGSGSAFTVGTKNYHSNMIIQSDSNENFLIDCGSDVRHSLHELGFSWRDISCVFISHLHADHVGGLEWLALNSFFSRTPKPKLYASKYLLDDLWEHVLSGGLGSIGDNISTFFDVTSIGEEKAFKWRGGAFQLVKTNHIRRNGVLAPSYGLYIQLKTKKIFITTDALISTNFYPFYNKADLIFHDCETSSKRSGVHAHYEDLKNLEVSIKQKMWLYHYNDGILPDAKADSFLGFVHKGQVFDFVSS